MLVLEKKIFLYLRKKVLSYKKKLVYKTFKL